MREVISLHVGQAGVQIGNACCECIVSKRVAQKKKTRQRSADICLFSLR